MNPDATVLFTIIPRAVTLGSGPLPVSVTVSPRLRGANVLGAFPDWLKWTALLKDGGLTLTIACGGASHEAAIDTEVLQPQLWAQLFDEETWVESYEYKDYTGRGIITYPVRDALSAIKTVYQEAAVELALPTPDHGERQSGNRGLLTEMLNGLDTHWNGAQASEWRSVVRRLNTPGRSGFQPKRTRVLDSEGLIVAPRDPTTFQNVAIPFNVFHHMPTPKPKEVPLELNTDDVIDFHRALSALNSYPPLLRALGLVFDLDLPADFVAGTPPGSYKTLAVKSVSLSWQTPTKTPALQTAYVNLPAGNNHLFLPAPLILHDQAASAVAAGLIALDPTQFGLAQVDVDGAMHKAINLADALNDPDSDFNLDKDALPEPAPNPEIYDPDATLPSLRSGGYTLFADEKGVQFLESIFQSKAFNDAVESGGAQSRPFFAEDLLRGYRVDIWDSHTNDWHSLHRRVGAYHIGDERFKPGEEEGFVQTAAMQPAPGAAEGPDAEDLYLHEAIARWAGWSLSVPTPGKHLSRYGDPGKAVPPDNDPTGEYAEDEPLTPFGMTVDYNIVNGSLPRLVFGRRYRLRARTVDLAGNSLAHDAPLAALLSLTMALPRSLAGLPYLRFEPVNAPLVVIRDPAAITGPGSSVNRLVIRTYNDNPAADANPADTTAGDRHLLPPRTSVEMGERLGMFDDATGKLRGDAATWQLIAERDAGQLNHQAIEVAGQPPQDYPVEPGDSLAALSYLPDLLAAGASLRDLPGAPDGALARVAPGGEPVAAVSYQVLNDPNPRPGSATLLSFGDGDWRDRLGLRLSLADPVPGQTDLLPQWDAAARVLTVFLPKGQTAITPLSTYLTANALKLMGQWEWLRQYIELITLFNPQPQYLQPGAAVDKINHVLQRAVEGGHWMINPPLLLTLVHAVQQPIGAPYFTGFNVDHDDDLGVADPLHTARVREDTDPAGLAAITSWRRLGGVDAFLMGALRLHGASTVQVDLRAAWQEPLDDESRPAPQTVERTASIETIALPDTSERYLYAAGENRLAGFYDPENDQIAFVRYGDRGGPLDSGYGHFFVDAAPRHVFNDTKRRRITYTAVASSRYREYFPNDAAREADGLPPLDFTRLSEPVMVDVPASARPLAPSVAYVLPTFGWQRQTESNIKRSVRFGNGLRVYLGRPWFSSGEGELLGVALWSNANGSLTAANRDKFKAYFTQWGMDPIWKTANLTGAPAVYHFPDSETGDYGVSLEEETARLSAGEPGRVDVAGFPVVYDPERRLWFADLTLNTGNTYAPFVRLALVRYQPHALDDARISRVVLADFVQLTPNRSVLLSVEPGAPRQLRVVVSGVAPQGPPAALRRAAPLPSPAARPTHIRVSVQRHDDTIASDLAWHDVEDSTAVVVTPLFDNVYPGQPDLEMWAGVVTFGPTPPPGRYRLLIEEYEYISADYTIANGQIAEQAGRLIFAETVELDEVLLTPG
ncbi:MAG: hypothetical protein KA586_07360 [Candidatus Promineofilum sp.]|nr:hypothetical protein [Promineifilum sp.]